VTLRANATWAAMGTSDIHLRRLAEVVKDLVDRVDWLSHRLQEIDRDLDSMPDLMVPRKLYPDTIDAVVADTEALP